MRRISQAVDRNMVIVTSVLCVLLVLVFLYLNHAPLWHTDVWAHVRYGQWMRTYADIPSVEPLNPWTSNDRYIPAAWLSQVLFSWVYDLGAHIPYRWSWDESAQPGGVELLRVFHAFVVAARFLFLYFAFYRFSGSRLVSLVGILLSFALSLTTIEVLRPQVLGELCLAIMLFLIARQPPTRFACWITPLVMALWSNLHGSYLNGLLIMLGVLFGRFLYEMKQTVKGETGEPLYRPAVRRLFRIFYWSILAVGLLNPYWSFQWIADTIAFARHPNVLSMDEWQRLEWNSLMGRLFLGSLALVVMTHAFAKTCRVAGIGFGHGLLLCCFGIQVVFMQRMMPWWAIVCPMVCVAPWARILGISAEAVRLQKWQPILVAMVVVTSAWIVVSFTSLKSIIFDYNVTRFSRSMHPGTPRQMDRATFQSLREDIPPQLFKAAHQPKASIFASETLGDYLFFAQRKPVVIFTHVHLFSPEHWRRCLAVKEGLETWQTYLDEWNTHIICVEAELHPQLCKQVKLSPRWEVVLDETGSNRKPNAKSRLFIAIRKEQP
jgi:hypothetical protein